MAGSSEQVTQGLWPEARPLSFRLQIPAGAAGVEPASSRLTAERTAFPALRLCYTPMNRSRRRTRTFVSPNGGSSCELPENDGTQIVKDRESSRFLRWSIRVSNPAGLTATGLQPVPSP